jgi:hypothetical protein
MQHLLDRECHLLVFLKLWLSGLLDTLRGHNSVCIKIGLH